MQTPHLRSAALGCLLAVVGFSYSLATAPMTTAGLGVESNLATIGSIQSSLKFTNPFLDAGIDSAYPDGGKDTDPKVYDLGDAVAGTHEITRYITATGGLPPYTFESTNLSTLASTLILSENGTVNGTIGETVSNPLRFDVTATDSSTGGSNTTSGRFRIGLIADGEFRFLVSSLSNGLLGLSYISKIDVAGGTLPITFSVVAGSVKLDGTAKDDLETLGLSVSSDGTVMGKPLEKGTVTFTARATDVGGNTALGRSPATTSDQEITIVVEDNSIVSSEMLMLKAKIKIATDKSNKDSVVFACRLNFQGNNLTDLNGKELTVRAGKSVVTGTFDPKGKIKTKTKTDKKNISAKPDKNELRFAFGKTDLSDAFGTISGNTHRVVIQVAIDDVITASEVVEMAAKGSGSKKQLSFKLGKTGRPLAGGFQVTNIKGKDTLGGNAWKIKFLAAPRLGIDANAGFNGPDEVAVLIGSDFSQQMSITNTDTNKFSEKGSKIQFSIKKASSGVKKLRLDGSKFIGILDTFEISSTDSGISKALGSSSPTANFSFVLDMTRTASKPGFTGLMGKKITNKRGSKSTNQWTDRFK